MALFTLSLYCFIKNGLYWSLLKIAFSKDFLLYLFIKNSLHPGFFALSLYQKQPFLRIFCFIALSKTAFICLMSLYWKQPFLLYCFIENSLYQPLSKMAFNKDFLLYCFIKNSLYQGFFTLSLYWKQPLWRPNVYTTQKFINRNKFILIYIIGTKLRHSM